MDEKERKPITFDIRNSFEYMNTYTTHLENLCRTLNFQTSSIVHLNEYFRKCILSISFT